MTCRQEAGSRQQDLQARGAGEKVPNQTARPSSGPERERESSPSPLPWLRFPEGGKVRFLPCQCKDEGAGEICPGGCWSADSAGSMVGAFGGAFGMSPRPETRRTHGECRDNSFRPLSLGRRPKPPAFLCPTPTPCPSRSPLRNFRASLARTPSALIPSRKSPEERGHTKWEWRGFPSSGSGQASPC